MRSGKSISSPKSSGGLRLGPMPLEWLDAKTWRLPSGQALAEFALQAGFLAPLLLQPERFGQRGGRMRSEPASKPVGENR